MNRSADVLFPAGVDSDQNSKITLTSEFTDLTIIAVCHFSLYLCVCLYTYSVSLSPSLLGSGKSRILTEGSSVFHLFVTLRKGCYAMKCNAENQTLGPSQFSLNCGYFGYSFLYVLIFASV